MDNADLLTPEVAAEQLGVAPQTVRHWARTHYIEARHTPGPRGRWMIPQSEVDRLLREAATR